MVNTSSSLQRHSLSNINCNDDKFSHHSQNKELVNNTHHNICGLSKKINELITFLQPNFPDFLCLTEHQLKQAQLELTYLDNFHIHAG